MWDDNDPDEYDYETGDDESETVPCPSCGEPIYEDSEHCPYCGEYVTFSTSAWEGRPLWWIVQGLIGVAAVIFVVSGLL